MGYSPRDYTESDTAGREKANSTGLLKEPRGESAETRKLAQVAGSREPRQGLNTTAVLRLLQAGATLQNVGLCQEGC